MASHAARDSDQWANFSVRTMLYRSARLATMGGDKPVQPDRQSPTAMACDLGVIAPPTGSGMRAGTEMRQRVEGTAGDLATSRRNCRPAIDRDARKRCTNHGVAREGTVVLSSTIGRAAAMRGPLTRGRVRMRQLGTVA